MQRCLRHSTECRWEMVADRERPRWRPLRVGGVAWAGLILAQPGRVFPRHGHSGIEFTCVLAGAFADRGYVYGVGDLDEPDVDHDHPPMVVSAEPCLCVIASEGMRLRGVLGRAQRPSFSMSSCKQSAS